MKPETKISDVIEMIDMDEFCCCIDSLIEKDGYATGDFEQKDGSFEMTIQYIIDTTEDEQFVAIEVLKLENGCDVSAFVRAVNYIGSLLAQKVVKFLAGEIKMQNFFDIE